jgi:hypothetical protein
MIRQHFKECVVFYKAGINAYKRSSSSEDASAQRSFTDNLTSTVYNMRLILRGNVFAE